VLEHFNKVQICPRKVGLKILCTAAENRVPAKMLSFEATIKEKDEVVKIDIYIER
jgi:hypothetical protein